MTICSNCQEQVQEGKNFCTRCGYPIRQDDHSKPLQGSAARAADTVPLSSTMLSPLVEDRSPFPQADDVLADETFVVNASFDSLPEGAFAGNKYFVSQIISAEPDCNVYSVEDTVFDESHHPFVLKESDDWHILNPELEIALQKLPNDGMRPPVDAFKQRVGGTIRYYVVLPPAAFSLSDIDIPVELPTVVNWGIALARGLEVLHAHQIAFGKATRSRIQLEGDQAYLSGFRGCLLSATAEQYFEDVKELADLLYELITGTRHYSPAVELPEPLKGIFAQIMTGIQEVSAAQFAMALAQGAEKIRRPDSIDLRVGRKTDVGQLRQLNEDSLYTATVVLNNQSISQPLGIFVVADGMGGHEGGEIASGMTIRTIGRLVAQEVLVGAAEGGSMPEIEAWLASTIQAANSVVFERGRESHNDMGTTVVMALMVGTDAYLAHVGDSRAYHVTNNSIKRITTDHSLVENLVAAKQITREEARYHPQSNVIYRTIGDKRTVEVDVNQTQIGPGEYLLLCSDGLNGMITDEAIHSIVVNADSPQAACEALVDAANSAGGEDNVTVIVIKPEA